MKHADSTVNRTPSAEPTMDDESMAMVYVGDVYSLVVQEQSAPVRPKKLAKHDLPQGEDGLWPLVR